MSSRNSATPSPEYPSYCINPKCRQRQNPDTLRSCQACGTSLFVNERYRLVLPLRGLDKPGNAELFELEDWGFGAADSGTPKVLKVLKPTSDPTKIRLFRQEAKVLISLRHPGIPRVEPDGYFLFPLSKGPKLHCLIMEKIEGLDLEEWLKKNGPISQELAINWLQQLAEILDAVHQKGLFHRDIKPSNIMLNPQEKLILIDFGTVREVSPTLLEKLEAQNITRIISKGYTAPEQRQGRAIPKSDLFSLGRTFVYLLTGISPEEFEDFQTEGLIDWQECATQISKSLADLIDELMALSSQNRPRNPRELLRRLAQIQFPDATNQSLPIGRASGEKRRSKRSPFIQKFLSKIPLALATLVFLGFINFKLLTPQLAISFNDRASDNYEADRLDSAQLFISLALMLNPNLGHARYIQGLLYDAHRNFDRARTEYELALPSLPDKVHNNIGRLDILAGNYDTAILHLQKGLQLVKEPKLESALHKNMGWVLLKQGKYEQAKSHLTKAIALDSDRASAYCLLGQLLEAEGDTAGALLQWKACIAPSLKDKRLKDKRLPELERWTALARQRLEDRDN